MGCYLYILRSEKQEKYYYGSSDDPDRRLPHHNNEKKGFTQRYRPWEIVYPYKFETRKEAEGAKRLVKGWKSKKITRLLIDGIIDLNDYL